MRTPVTGLSVTGLSLIALCAGLLVGQVLIRPAIGQANNGDFPKMAKEGIIAWQLHAGFKSMEVTFKDIQFKDLGKR